MAAIVLAIFCVLAVTDWIAVAAESKAVEYFAKPGALAALWLYAALGASAPGWLLAALAFSLAGDVALMLPADLFAAGLAAFLLAHVAYVVAFHATAWARLGWFVIVALGSLPMARRILRSVAAPPLRRAVTVYILVILLMVASAFASGRPLAATGAVLFFASDGLIAWNRFVRPLSWGPPVIMITYHLGQLGLAVALRGG